MTICQDPEAEEAAAEALEADSEGEALAVAPEEAALEAADITVDLEVPRAEDSTEALFTVVFLDREDIITVAVAASEDLRG